LELPGQAFDIDFLVTDGYETTYILVDQPNFDRLEVETWYNRTRFEGNAQRPGKRRRFLFTISLDLKDLPTSIRFPLE